MQAALRPKYFLRIRERIIKLNKSNIKASNFEETIDSPKSSKIGIIIIAHTNLPPSWPVIWKSISLKFDPLRISLAIEADSISSES
jgi:hypothetical protein